MLEKKPFENDLKFLQTETHFSETIKFVRQVKEIKLNKCLFKTNLQ